MSKSEMIFVGGHRKTGTTLFLNLLDSHPALAVFPYDLFLLYGYFPVYTAGNYSSEEKKARLDQVLFRYPEHMLKEKGWRDRLSIDAVRSVFFQKLEVTYLDDVVGLMRTLVSAFRSSIHVDATPISVVKETSLEIYAPMLLEQCPNSKFIHILRDPRDNYAALRSGLKARHAEYPDDANTILASMINRYGLGWRLAEMNRKQWGDDRYLIIRHEDTVTDCRRQMEKVADFIGIPFNESMLTPTFMGGPTKGSNFEKKDMAGAFPAMKWLLNLCDGHHDLLDIAERSGERMDILIRTADRLAEVGLLTNKCHIRRGDEEERDYI